MGTWSAMRRERLQYEASAGQLRSELAHERAQRGEDGNRDTMRRLREENGALQRQVAALDAEADALAQANEELTAKHGKERRRAITVLAAGQAIVARLGGDPAEIVSGATRILHGQPLHATRDHGDDDGHG